MRSTRHPIRRAGLAAAGALLCLALAACGPRSPAKTSGPSSENAATGTTGQAAPAEQPTKTVTTETAGETTVAEAIPVCPDCGSTEPDCQPAAYEDGTADPQTCPYDQLTFATNVVVARRECLCRQCGARWVQQDRYLLSSCPAHGTIFRQHEQEVV